MTKNTLKIFLLALTLTITSCKKELDPILESDYKVVEVDYAFDNYIKNIRDKSDQLIIKERNIVEVYVGIDGRTVIENNEVEDSLIVAELKKYISPKPENNEMPITIDKEFQYSGKVNLTKNLIVLASFNGELNYEKFSKIRNKIHLSFNQVRNEFSMNKFNQNLEELIKSNKEEDIIKWQEIRQIFPIRYYEIIEEK